VRLAIDIETTGLSPWNDDIVAVGIAWEDGGWSVHTPWDVDWEFFPVDLSQHFLEADEVVVHNGAFDLVWLKVAMGVSIPDNVWDTMIAEALITAGYDDSVSLSETLLRRFQIVMDKELQTSFTLEEKPSKEQVEYLVKDIQHLFDIRNQQVEDIQAYNLQDVWDIEKSVTPVFCSMIHDGIKVDVPLMTTLIDREKGKMQSIADDITSSLTPLVMHQRIAKFDKQRHELYIYEQEVLEREEELGREWQAAMKRFIAQDVGEWPEEWFDTEIDKKDNKEKGLKRFTRHHMKTWREYNKRPPPPKLNEEPINLGSPQQVKEAFQRMGVAITSTTAAEMKSVLPTVKSQQARDILEKIITYKKAAKMVQAFGDTLFQFLDSENKLHGQFRQYGTQTGRPTCTQPNLLQMPNSDEFRRGFIAEDGMVMVVADFSQMELRLTAELSHDKAMLRAFSEGLDLHTNTAALMFNVPYDKVEKSQRSVAKTINFGILYGMGANKLQSTLASPKGSDEPVHLTPKEAKDAIQKWMRAYPQAAQSILQWGQDAVRYGYTETAFGRRRHFRVLNTMTEWELGSIRRQGANHVIQGSNADVTKLAMVMTQEMLRPMGGSVRLQVYDEIVASVPEKHGTAAAHVVYSCMMAAAEEVLHKVPAAVDCVVSPSWSETQAILEL
jgi:DNA polymerase-1